MSKNKNISISVHKTLNGQLQVDWDLDYHQEYNCPHCNQSKLTRFYYYKQYKCKLVLYCNRCQKHTYLTCALRKMGLKNSPISKHQTLNENLEINWSIDYNNEYGCPHCNQSKLTRFYYHKTLKCNLALQCNKCQKYTYLTCSVPVHISRYRPKIECPNSACNLFGHDGQKGWIYKYSDEHYQCYFCKICFNVDFTKKIFWSTSLEEQLLPFSFKEDTWYLKYFYDESTLVSKTLNFYTIQPDWYKQKVKKYAFYLLRLQSKKSRTVYAIVINLKQFSEIIISLNIKNKHEINRKAIIQFLDIHKINSNTTINNKLSFLRDFFDWLELETPSLIHRRDFRKIRTNDVDWLDEVTRQSIKQHLDKIPAPIARHYLVQAYIAARPIDVCRLAFDCLVEENGKWYVKFFQQKTERWHKILASRKIRKVIEEQQQWIRKTFGEEYAYLFCHFTNIRQDSYPLFLTIRPHAKPSTSGGRRTPMVYLIRMLIEKENILDANGLKPHFTGKITRASRLQEVRTKYGMEAAQLYADHKKSTTTFQHYAPPTREQIAKVDLPFQELLLNPDNKFLPWQSLPESLLKNPKAHELDLEIAPRLVVYGHCALNPKTPCPVNLFPKCYGCSSFRPSTSKLSLYERQYQGEQQRLAEADKVGAELAHEEAKATIEAMDKWLPELRRLANG